MGFFLWFLFFDSFILFRSQSWRKFWNTFSWNTFIALSQAGLIGCLHLIKNKDCHYYSICIIIIITIIIYIVLLVLFITQS